MKKTLEWEWRSRREGEQPIKQRAWCLRNHHWEHLEVHPSGKLSVHSEQTPRVTPNLGQRSWGFLHQSLSVGWLHSQRCYSCPLSAHCAWGQQAWTPEDPLSKEGSMPAFRGPASLHKPGLRAPGLVLPVALRPIRSPWSSLVVVEVVIDILTEPGMLLDERFWGQRKCKECSFHDCAQSNSQLNFSWCPAVKMSNFI